MSLSSITLLAFVAITLLVISVAMLAYDWFFRYRAAVRGRLNELSGDASAHHEISLFKDIRRLRSQDLFQDETLKERLQRTINQAGVQRTTAAFLATCLATGLLLMLAGACRAWWLGVVLFPAGVGLPVTYLLIRIQVRQRKLSRQLPEAFAMISRAVRAGQTVPAALQIIAEDFDPPISTEFALCYEQQNLGMSRESALHKLATRSGIMELQIFVVALLVQSKSGGDLVELLDNLASMVRKRLKLKDRVRALTGEGRMQAIVLIALPVAVFLGIIFLSPDYAKSLLDRPWLLGCTATAQAVGAFWIRKIVNFQY